MKPTKHILATIAMLLCSLAAKAEVSVEVIDIANNADAMLYTNAKCTNTSYGDQFAGWHVLFDNDPSTFFHSEYSNKNSEDGLDHYLRVDLGEGSKVNAFSFTYTVRGSIPYNGNYSPKTMIVEGSNTAYGTYTELVSLNNLPNTGAAVYKSPVIRNGTAYRYIRFRVTETYTNSKVQGHSYFFMAEFGMMRVRIEGTCGDNLSWKLTDDNELVIEGTGDMYDYSSERAPWYEYRESIQTITIGEGVTSIGNYAFSGCSSLNSITIPEGVTSIGEHAFYKCSSLTTIVVEEGNNVYDSRGGCNAIIETSSNTLTHGCSATIIPEGVTSIGNYAFYYCSSLTSITIPESVTSIGGNAFEGCSSLEDVILNSTNVDNWFSGISSIKRIVLGEGVTSIGHYAFRDCSSLTSIAIPESVTSIGSGAFRDCSSLTSITIPEGVTSIGDWAFYECSSLTAITILENSQLTSIGHYAFRDCSSLTSITIPENSQLTSIGNYAFEDCSSLTSITIPESVTSIGNYAFYECSSLTSITIPENSQLTSIGNYAFSYCSSLTAITIPEGVTSIGEHAFYKCSSLTSITIPESVTSIGSGAFRDCSSLTSITIPESVTSIGGNAFEGCSSLEDVILNSTNVDNWFSGISSIKRIVLGEGVTSIGNSAFRECSSLTSITIPESVTSIGSSAFYSCSSLTSITIPEGVTSIGGSAFEDCSSLTSITIPESVTSIGSSAFYGTSWYNNQPDGVVYVNNVLYKYKGTMPANTSIDVREGTVSISPYAFRDCSSLTSITIPEGVTSIGGSAFEDCSSLTEIHIGSIESWLTIIYGDCYSHPNNAASNVKLYIDGEELTEVEVPSTVTSIPSYAFYGCSSLTSITIPEGVTSIGSGAFRDCSSLKTVINYSDLDIQKGSSSNGYVAYYADRVINVDKLIDGYAFKTKDGVHSLTGYIGDDTELTLPTDYQGENYQIGDDAFYGCSSLTSITIPEGVTSIGSSAFYSCSSLTSITIPEGVTSIGNSAFHECSSLTAITIPEGVTSIGDYAFYSCSSLTSITIPEGVTSIGNSAFRECSSLTSITIPEGVTSIGNSAFRECSGLTSITIPEGVTSIGGNAFEGCSSLTSITIPEGVTSIGSGAFSGCSNLTSITIPEGVTSIGGSAFEDCSSLTSITIPESVTSIGSSAFYGCSSLTSITIPEGVTSIGHYAFRDCSSLTSITIPEGVTSIGNYAFYNCSNLTSITIPEGVTSIGDWAFYGCSSLTSITIPEGVTSIGNYAFYNCSNLTSITIPEGVTSIGDWAFRECGSLTEIHIGSIESWLTIIYGDRFSHPNNAASNVKLYIDGEELTEVEVPSTVTSIPSYAFYGCSSLTSITIPEGVTSIGEYAFRGCSSLTAITIPEGVTSIGDYAFYSCSSLTSITCNATTPPALGSVTTFGSVNKSIPVYVSAESVDAYKAAEYWKEFTDINGVVASGTCGDNLTWKLTEEYELVIEGTGDMYDYTQGGTPWNEYRDAILAIALPEGMTRIGNWAFSDCTSVTTITVPASVTSIGYGILMGCNSLTSIDVEEGNTVYDSRNGCNAIIKTSNNTLVSGCSATVIPEGVTSIGDYAFGYCGSLTTITLPESMAAVGAGAFIGCHKLAELTSLATTPPTIGSNTTFGNVDKAIPVYVPAKSVEAYKVAAYWSEFTNYQPIAVTITINQYGSGTYSSAYALDFSEVQGLKAYVATGYNYHTGVVTLLRVHTADAATGLLVKGTPGASYEVPVMEYTADRTLNMLVPTLERTEVDSRSSDGVYANYKYTVDPAQNPDEPLFYPFADDSHLSAGKAYLQIPVAWLPDTGQKSIRYRFDEGETTDIEDEEIRNQKSEIIYDLYGRRVVSPKKGEIYIVNNQKVVY